MSTAKVKPLTEEDMARQAEQHGGLISEEEAAALLEKRGHQPGEARPLDLSRLRIASGNMPLLEVVNQSFVASASKSLTALLKREVQVSLQRIETQKTSDYYAQLPNPACLDLAAVKPLKGSALFCMDPGLIFVLVDSFYGGSGRGAARDPQRGLTPAELKFSQLLLRQLFVDLKTAWAPVKQLEFEAGKHENSHTFLDFAQPNDNILVNRFLVELPGGAGHIDFVLTEAMIEPIRDALSGGGNKPAPAANANAAAWGRMLAEHLKGLEVQVSGVLGETRVNLRDLKGLKPGDVISIDPPGPATLLVGGVPVLGAKFGVSRDRNALKITGPIHYAAPRPGSK